MTDDRDDRDFVEILPQQIILYVLLDSTISLSCLSFHTRVRLKVARLSAAFH
jgi:hypothetical protein